MCAEFERIFVIFLQQYFSNSQIAAFRSQSPFVHCSEFGHVEREEVAPVRIFFDRGDQGGILSLEKTPQPFFNL